MPWRLALPMMAAASLTLLLVDFLRLRLTSVKGIFIVLFGSMLRRKELSSLTGASYLMLASLVCMLIFGRDPSSDRVSGVFIAAIGFLALGDTAAAIVGLSIGRVRIFRKTLEGTVAGLLVCLGVAWLVSILPGLDFPLGIGILGAVSASVVEALPIEVNDNVVIPLLSGTVMMIALQIAR